MDTAINDPHKWSYDWEHRCWTRVLPDDSVEWWIGVDPATFEEEPHV